MNPETIKLLIWAAMHHPAFPEVRFEPFIDFCAYASEFRTGFSFAINKVRVTVPSAIAWEYRYFQEEVKARALVPTPAYEAGYEDEF